MKSILDKFHYTPVTLDFKRFMLKNIKYMSVFALCSIGLSLTAQQHYCWWLPIVGAAMIYFSLMISLTCYFTNVAETSEYLVAAVVAWTGIAGMVILMGGILLSVVKT